VRRDIHAASPGAAGGRETSRFAATIVWFRSDLRLTDHPALAEAVGRKGPVVPLFNWAPEEEDPWRPGAASRWWLRRSLASLDDALRTRGSRLIVRRGTALQTLRDLARETGARTVCWSRRYDPSSIARDAEIKKALIDDGIEAVSFNASLLVEPWKLATSAGGSFQVFTAFWKACAAAVPLHEPLPAHATLPAPATWPDSLPLSELGLDPEVPWDAGLRETWTPGEIGAQTRLDRFLAEALSGYPSDRDRPDRPGSSRLSPHLHFGEIGPRQIWFAVQQHAALAMTAGPSAGAETYLREIGWREFAHHLLFHFPRTLEEPLRGQFARFPWIEDPAALRAWQRGRTGYPLVDAAMRELWATGWMHNRARMIAASFLVKDLLVSWRHGARWFWDTLVDADLANNTLGWQWTAGCGADAAPYFRIFNPITQGRKFDPEGAYVRRWVPELMRLPSEHIHSPWTAPQSVLSEAGVRLGFDYPAPIVDHARARTRALAALASLKS
jgi:deoxyribodipyrimidine photo-lyase